MLKKLNEFYEKIVLKKLIPSTFADKNNDICLNSPKCSLTQANAFNDRTQNTICMFCVF